MDNNKIDKLLLSIGFKLYPFKDYLYKYRKLDKYEVYYSDIDIHFYKDSIYVDHFKDFDVFKLFI